MVPLPTKPAWRVARSAASTSLMTTAPLICPRACRPKFVHDTPSKRTHGPPQGEERLRAELEEQETAEAVAKEEYEELKADTLSQIKDFESFLQRQAKGELVL